VRDGANSPGRGGNRIKIYGHVKTRNDHKLHLPPAGAGVPEGFLTFYDKLRGRHSIRKMDISVVTPVYNEDEALPAFYRALAEALDQLPQSAEIVFADDGSTDGSADRLDAIAETDPRVRVLHLSRNYGQTAALMAAIQNSSGDVVIPIDGDGQNDPADIPRLLEKLAEGFDVVSGWRLAREDNTLTRRLPSVVANWLISQDVRLYGEMHPGSSPPPRSPRRTRSDEPRCRIRLRAADGAEVARRGPEVHPGAPLPAAGDRRPQEAPLCRADRRLDPHPLPRALARCPAVAREPDRQLVRARGA
jgi:hypothetical protein